MSINFRFPTTKDNTTSGASGPAKAEPSVQYSESKLGEIKTTTDGHTKVTESSGDNTRDDISRGVRNAYFNMHGKYPPCINTDCRSYGRPHPNCLCFGPLSQAGNFVYAKGGQVCSGPHKENCEHFADGGIAESNSLHLNNPHDSLDHVGLSHGLLHLLTKLGSNGRSENAHKHLEDYVDSSKRGHKTLESHISKLFSKEKMDIPKDKEGVENLKNHLNEIELNPDKAFDIGGDLGSILPDHSAALGYKAGNAINYFQKLKPKSSKASPLDPVIEPSKQAHYNYDRQLSIAQNPSLILHHAKHGTLTPLDLTTLHTIYPSLSKSMTAKSADALIDAKMNNKPIDYRKKQGLSTLLGQSLDSTQTPEAMQAIIMANSSMQAPSQQKKPKKASGTELKQIDKVNDQLATPNQSRVLDKKE